MNEYFRKDDISQGIAAAARKAWERGADLRSRRARYKRFTYGDQWSDPVTDSDGMTLTAYDHARRAGKRPMTNNLIRRLVKCIVGRFRQMVAEENTGKELSEEYRRNNLDELDSRALEEFLISGCAIQKVSRERRPEGDGVWVDNINPQRFIVNRFDDPRGIDIRLVGMLHDMSVTEIVMGFAHGDQRRALELRRLFSATQSYCFNDIGNGSDVTGFAAASEGKCRILEIWTLEARQQLRCHDHETGEYFLAAVDRQHTINRENETRLREKRPPVTSRWEMNAVWRCRWMTTDGIVIDSHDSPYSHGSHPFVVKFYPLTDGEVHSLVEDVIDQQIYVNNLITLIDHVISTSAKGVLMFPEEQKSDMIRWDEIGRIWASPDGVLPYRAGDGVAKPEQIVTKAGDMGARELLTLQMKMFEDVSGVSNALMGKTSGGVVGAERFESEVRNATVAINDLLKTFCHFRDLRDSKMKC